MFKRMTVCTAAAVMGAVLYLGSTSGSAQGEDGKALYDKNCISCHGPGGNGDGPIGKALKPPPGDFATSLKKVSDDDVAKLIKDGGKPLGKTHPAFGKKFSDEQTTALVKYVRELAGL